MDNTKLVKTKSKKKIVFLTLVLLCFVIGASYAIWNYVFTGEDNSITTSDISIDFLEDNDVISLTNALPILDDDGKNGEVFDFAVTTDTVREMGINYVLSIEKLPLEEGYTSLNDSDIKIYLTDENDNVLVEPTLISDLDNYQLYSNTNMHNNINSTIKDKYKLRVWIDKDVSTNEWDENTLNQYMFRINVRAEQPSKYSITFNPNDGEVDISSKIVVNETQYGTLPIPIRANWIFDGWYTSIVGGTRVTSETIANLSSDQTLYARWKDDTTPSLSVSVPNGTTYAKTKTATVTLTDTLSGLSSASKTIRYIWSTTAPTQTCNDANYPNEITITPTSGNVSKAGTITINEETGAGKLYICNSTNITDVYGNILPTSYKNANMYLDNTDPSLTLTKNGVISDFKGWELTNEASIEDNILTMASLPSTALSPFYQVSEENYRWEFEVYTTSTTTTSATKGGFYVGWRYYDSSFNSYVASNGYSGNGQARSVELNTWTPFTTAAKSQYGYGTGVEYFRHFIGMENRYSTPTTKYRNYKMHGENLYSKEKYTITLSTSDANTSIATKKYASGNQNASYFASSGTNITNDSFEITENGTYTIYVADAVGNYKLETVTINKIDKIAPAISTAAEANNSYEASKIITATATDCVAGIVAYQFTETNTEPTNWITINTAKMAKTVTTTVTSNKTYYVWFVDGAGNVSSEAIPVTHVDTTAPNTPVVTRSDYNTFTYSATDNIGVTGYKITTTSTKPAATDSGWITTTSYDIEQTSNTYYVWAKDAAGNISVSKSIATYLVTRNEGTGTTLTTKLESSTGTAVTSNTYVLSGTPVYIAGVLTTGYNSLSITAGGEPFTSGNVKTITSATTITSSAILNSHIVSVSVINGTISGDTQKEVENNNSTSFTFVPNNGYNSAVVNCTNEQISTFASNVLTVGPVTSDTMCTVIYESKATVLYEDGTLIINELESNRQANIAVHGEIMNTYNAMSESESYVFDIDYDNWSTNTLWFNEGESIISVEIGESIQPVSTSGWFYGLYNFETGDFTNLDTSQVINMSSMFNDAGCDALSFNLIGLNNWNTSQVENMSSMFDYAGTSATTWDIGDLSNWNTSQVENMSSMFMQVGANATTWDIGDLSNWNTSQVKNMSDMFREAGTSATTWDIGDLSSWDTSLITDMNRMFYRTGDESTTFNSIGMLNIPSGCSLEEFAYTSSKFKGILILNGTPLNYDNMLDGTSTEASAYVNLYYTDSASQTFVEELITLYGPSGTSSQGNIYNMGQYVATP